MAAEESHRGAPQAAAQPVRDEPLCACPFGKFIDDKIEAEERARTWHVWCYVAEQLAAHLIAIVGLTVVKKAHGCGEGSERTVWLAERVRQSVPYKNTPWCMPAPAPAVADIEALAAKWEREAQAGPSVLQSALYGCARELRALGKVGAK